MLKSILFIAIIGLMNSPIFGQSYRSSFTYPTAGDQFVAGQTASVKWFPNQSNAERIWFSVWDQSEGQWHDLGVTDFSSGMFDWVPPINYGKSFRLKGVTNEGEVFYSNGYFSILPATKEVVKSYPSQNEMLSVHPNPASSQTRICFPDPLSGNDTKMIVVNSVGEIVSTIDPTSDPELGLCGILDCSILPDGLYFASLQKDRSGKSVKIVIQH